MGKASSKPAAKRRHRTSIRTMKADLADILEDLKALQSTQPYLTDADAFLTQAIVCIEKQIVTEGKPDAPAKA